MSQYYILENGKPKPATGVLEWGKWFETASRTVEKTTINGVRISTVFLGIDHSFGNTDQPVLWETMIFEGKHDGYQERYSSLEDAKEGHKKAVELVMEKND